MASLGRILFLAHLRCTRVQHVKQHCTKMALCPGYCHRLTKLIASDASLWPPKSFFDTSVICLKSAPLHTCNVSMAPGKLDTSQKKRDKPVVLLLDMDGNSMGQMLRADAETIATNNEQILVEIKADSKVPTVKLEKSIVNKNSLPESKIAKAKPLKTLKIGSKINDHDLEIKLRHVAGWLAKGHEVLIIVENADKSDPKKMKTVFEIVSDACKDSAKIKKVEKSVNILNFYLKPKSGDSSAKKGELLKPMTMEELQENRKK